MRIVSRDGSGDSQGRLSADRNSPDGGSLIRTDGLEGAVLGGGRMHADCAFPRRSLTLPGEESAGILQVESAPVGRSSLELRDLLVLTAGILLPAGDHLPLNVRTRW